MKVRGNRTFITIAAGILLTVGEFLNDGSYTGGSYLELVQTIVPYMAGIFLRMGIK